MSSLQRVLDGELERWQAKSTHQLTSELKSVVAYEVKSETATYQVEMEMLENTAMYVHVMVAVDDGRLPSSLKPLSSTFICRKS